MKTRFDNTGSWRGLAAAIACAQLSLAGCEASPDDAKGSDQPSTQTAAPEGKHSAKKKTATSTTTIEVNTEPSLAKLANEVNVETPAPSGNTKEETSKEADRQATFDDLIDEADDLAAQGWADEALVVYAEAAKRDPNSAIPEVEMARLLIGANKPTEAKAHAEKAATLAPTWSTSWNTLGRAQLQGKDLEAAVEAFTRATEVNPQNIYAWNNLGLVRNLQGRHAEAVAALKQAASDDHAVAYMFNNLGVAYEKLGRIEEALTAYKEGLALGSTLAGKNFVRLERKQDLPQTARRTEADTMGPGQSGPGSGRDSS